MMLKLLRDSALDVVDARRGAHVLLEAPADRLLDVLRRRGPGASVPMMSTGGVSSGKVSTLMRGVTTRGEDHQPDADHQDGDRVAQRRAPVTASARSAGGGRAAPAVERDLLRRRRASPSSSRARPSVTTGVPAVERRVDEERAAELAQRRGTVGVCATSPSTTKTVAFAPRIDAASSGISVAGRGSPTSMRTSPVVSTGMCRVRIGQVDLEVHRARVGVGGWASAARWSPASVSPGGETRIRTGVAGRDRRRSRPPARRRSCAPCVRSTTDTMRRPRDARRRPDRWCASPISPSNGARRMQSFTSSVRARQLRLLRLELRRLGGALRRLLLGLVRRDEAAVEQAVDARRLVGERPLPRVDRPRLRRDGLAGRARVAAVERRQHLAALHDRARAHQHRVDVRRDELRADAAPRSRAAASRRTCATRGRSCACAATTRHRLGRRRQRHLVRPATRRARRAGRPSEQDRQDRRRR